MEMFRARDRERDISTEALERRLDLLNEFRGAMGDQTADLLPRQEFFNLHSIVTRDLDTIRVTIARMTTQNEVNEKATILERVALDRLEARISDVERKNANWDGKFWAFGVLVTILNVAVNWYIMRPR